MTNLDHRMDPKLELQFERMVDLPAEKMWAAWTMPEHIKHWFTPAPWKTTDCEIDLRPGGLFRTIMRSPDGQEFPNIGCYLEIIPNQKLVWTNALLPGFRPNAKSSDAGSFAFTAIISLRPHDDGAGAVATKYTARVIHADEAGCQQHAKMGFEAGWGKALDQLLVYMKQLPLKSARAEDDHH